MTAPPLRVLGALRLSKYREESTSITRQREEVQRWADYQHAQVVDMAEDTDVSGAVSPFARPSLGPWLTERADRWDVLVVTKVDRLGRSMADVHVLVAWLKEHGKRLVVIAQGIDTGQAGAGPMVLAVMAAVAEMERDAIRERARESYAHLARERRWRGGQVPYGHTPVPIPGGGYRLVVDEEAQSVVQELARRVIAGERVNALCEELNERGTLPPADHQRFRKGEAVRGERWHNANTRRLLMSPTLLGRMTETLTSEDGREVSSVHRDAMTGMPLERAMPLLSQEDWQALQAALASRAPRKVQKHPPALLTSMLWCECGLRMNRNNSERPYRTDQPLWSGYYQGRGTGYYRCASIKRRGHKCPGASVREDETDASAVLQWQLRVGAMAVPVRRWVPGNDVAKEYAATEVELQRVMDEGRNMLSEARRRRHEMTLAVLDARLAELEAQEAVEGHWEVVDTGRTYAADDDSDVSREEMAADMRAVGVRVEVSHNGSVSVVLPPDVEERLGERVSARKGQAQ